ASRRSSRMARMPPGRSGRTSISASRRPERRRRLAPSSGASPASQRNPIPHLLVPIPRALDGKIPIRSGAGSGIGRAGARLMAREGARVIVGDINESAGQAAVSEIESGGGIASFQPVDVRDSASVQDLVRSTVARHGRIDALFHNAVDVAMVNRRDNRATELPEEVWHSIVGLVLTGTFLCAKYVGR